MGRKDRPVLLVEDDPDLRDVMRQVLEEQGFRVDAVAEGREALAHVERELPVVILLDLRMPGMDGWQFAQAFHARYGHLAPIIVVTADPDARREAEALEAESFLAKPFDTEQVVGAIESVAHPGH